MQTLEFFFDLLSAYSYLASTQVEAVCARTGAALVWRPFLLGAVFKATENVSPLNNPHKAAYLLKDLQRWADHYGIPPLTFPAEFPFRVVDADRLVLVAGEDGKAGVFARAAFSAIWAEGRDLGTPDALAEVLRSVGIDPAPALERAGSIEIKDALKKNGEEAVSRGAFGAPTFFIGDEMYVGNDRLAFVERALAGR
ncbi:MAG TPA: 2-hydroxychromene-2-carboxylate isomerase [Myxococcaceae bacterium]|nr:2-hydroxychromene-2-carboxylate isomerase [Myxococcaceae bacterium]